MSRSFPCSCLVMLLTAVGCGGNPCEEAADRMADKYDDCAVAYDEPAVSEECPDEAREQLECAADCAESAPCGALDGSDAAASGVYLSCIGGCV